jgi:hypothetical protein
MFTLYLHERELEQGEEERKEGGKRGNEGRGNTFESPLKKAHKM